MKKYLKVLALLFSILLLSGGFAVADSLVRVVTEDSPPFNYLAASGEISGTATQIVRHVLDESGVPYTMQVLPWARAYAVARKTPDVFIYSMARTPKRERLFHWIGPVAQLRSAFYRLAEREDLQAERLADVKSHVVGGVNLDFGLEYLRKHGFRVEGVANDDQTLSKLLKGRVDYMLADESGFEFRISRLGLDRSKFKKELEFRAISVDLYLAASLETDMEMLQRVAEAYDRVARTEWFEERISGVVVPEKQRK